MRAIEFRGPSMSEPLENQQISLGNIELLVGQQPEFSVRLVKALKLVDFARSSASFSASLAARWRLCSSFGVYASWKAKSSPFYAPQRAR
jgi:hypothetical protein